MEFIDDRPIAQGYVEFQWYSAVPGGWFSNPKWTTGGVSLPLASGSRPQVVTFIAGRADPHDPSRFVIPYRLDDVAGEIQGQVHAGGRVTLLARSGPLMRKP